MAEFRRQWLANPINHVPDDRPEVAARIAGIVEHYGAADILQTPTRPPRPHTPAIERIHEITAPTLVLVGGQDLQFFQITADAIAFEIPGSERVTVRGGGHLVNMIEPELYNAEVLRFLRIVDRRRCGVNRGRVCPPQPEKSP
jgi:pimeloyl-ACP methyl ester carboxylesterase